MKGFIYKITNRVNNKVYIGQTHFTIEHRFKQHIKNYNIEHRKQPLYMAFDKYGIDNFYIEALEEVECDKLDEREKMWLEVGKHDPDYRVWKRKIKVEKKNAWKMLLAGDKNIRHRLF